MIEKIFMIFAAILIFMITVTTLVFIWWILDDMQKYKRR